MPKRTDISSILAITAALALSACGDNGTTNRSETTTLKEPATATVGECLERFANGRDVWGDTKVKASFVYEVQDFDMMKAEAFWGDNPEADGKHSVTTHNGEGGNEALEEFLKSDPKGDTELFSAEGVSLIRINDGPSENFEAALRTGCERLREGVTVRQVTFSQG